ncbi:uncharacterized protein LOC111307715 isoform X2 [Durio zibethinus]|uniref:Uncharacterized protein LOC111307715 isoform X2 n=1 Tax=Durio zibethinus TaxID=66656 RepID=A0A6P6A9M1_DURZI|nr:uncharacterized protein LOC111307715 isoform X2 [Durio zibethinus]
MMKQSEPTNNSSSKGETNQQLPSNYLGNDHILTPEVQLDFHQEPLVEMEVSNDYDWIQNQSSISEQTNEFVNSFPVVYSETYPEERNNQEDFVNGGNKVNSNLQPFNLEYYVADYAIPQNPQVDYMRPITNPEGAQNQLIYTTQHDHSFQNVLTYNDETYPEERSNQHNIVAEDEGVNLPSNFYNDPIADISQMNLFDFDDLYWDGIYLHELKATDNNCDGVQNQSSINQQVADEFRNSNLIGNEIAYPDERNKSAAAEIEGSNLPSLGMTESSHPMESFRKGSGMEHEGSSTDIGTEVAQAQAKKRRF